VVKFPRFLNEIGIDLLNKSFRSRSHSTERDRGNKESGSYQDTKATPDQRIGILRRENANGGVGFVYKGNKAESRKSKGQDDQT